MLADNKLALNAGWDHEMLAIELQGLIDLEFDVELTGFSLAEVDLVLDEAQESAPTGAGGRTTRSRRWPRRRGRTAAATCGCWADTASSAAMPATRDLRAAAGG